MKIGEKGRGGAMKGKWAILCVGWDPRRISIILSSNKETRDNETHSCYAYPTLLHPAFLFSSATNLSLSLPSISSSSSSSPQTLSTPTLLLSFDKQNSFIRTSN